MGDKNMKDDKVETVTRLDLAKSISSAVSSFSATESQLIVDSVIKGIRDSLAKGEEVKISGFGKFTLQTKNPRKGRNPKTGESITISGRRVMKFKPSQVFRNALNEVPVTD